MTAAPLAIADVLDRAADLIERKDAWMQGDFCDGQNIEKSSCWSVEGAVAKVLGIPGMDAEIWCDRHFSPLVLGGRNAAQWNDTPGRTQSEVVAALREAASKAREGRGE
jgi:hypothetical protein